MSTNDDNLLTIAELSGKCESTAAWIRDQVESGLMPSGVKNAAPYAKNLPFALSTAPTNPDVPILKPKTGPSERVNRTVEQVSKISQMASPDIGGQLEFPGVPDHSPHRVNQVKNYDTTIHISIPNALGNICKLLIYKHITRLTCMVEPTGIEPATFSLRTRGAVELS